MPLTSLWKPTLFHTGLLGLLTVGTIYVTTHSGFLILIGAGIGLILVVLGGGTAGPMSAAGTEHAEDAGAGMVVEDMSLWPHSYTDTSLRIVLFLYGLGVFVWSLVILLTLRDTLA